jgi:hypothetical protein
MIASDLIVAFLRLTDGLDKENKPSNHDTLDI